MPVSPDVGTSIARVVQATTEADYHKFRTNVREAIKLFLSGDPSIVVGEIVLGLTIDSMRSMGFYEDDAKRVLEAGIAELTQPAE